MNDNRRPVPKHEVLFDIEQALCKARTHRPRKRVHGEHHPFRPVARAVVEHLDLCGISCFRKPPAPPHSTSGNPVDTGLDSGGGGY